MTISNHLIIQNKPTKSKTFNLLKIKTLITENKISNINFIILPECFNCPYGIEYFKEYAEELVISENNPTISFLHEISKLNPEIYLIGGSIPEKYNESYYNTTTVWLNGEMICVYRKMHLFDIAINDKIVFKESSVLTPGKNPSFFTTPYGRIGLGICFDLRFNDLSNYYSKNNCDMIVYPGSFSKYTGELHWELLLRTRAVDSQCWTLGISTAFNPDLNYQSYGHSLICDPWGRVVSEKLGDKEGVIIVKIDTRICKSFQDSIPVRKSLLVEQNQELQLI
jgi:predicted amidohydrolase